MARKVITQIIQFALAAAVVFGLLTVVQAATGNIDATNKWAWGTNVGWINFAPTHGGVTVYSDHLEGYAWGENIGWIRLGTHTGGSPHTYLNTAADNYGVNNDGSGNLSGYAWGTNVGWINFNPTHSQVTIDPVTGDFDGYAWGENVGWIHFQNASPAYKVATSWRGDLTASEVRVTNVRDTSFAVSWITDIPSDGHVNYGTDPAALDQTVYDDRGAETSDDTHHVTLLDLTPENTYYFDVVSDGTTDDNGGAHYSVTTGPTLGLPPSDQIFGQVFKEDGTTLAEGTIVYITLFDDDGSGSSGQAAELSSLVDNTGYWYANLGNARTSDLSAYFDYSASGDQVRLEAQGAADGTGCLLVDTADDSPAADLILNVSTCLVEAEIPLQIGWNHISLPLDPLTSYTAEGVCIEINSQGGDVAEIDRWYASGWDGHICGLPFNDFAIELGSDYFIRSNAVSTWTIEGYEVTTGVPLDLQIGWNSIGVPHSDACTAESLCDEIIDQGVTAIEIDRWYASGWDGHICGLPFNDFDIEIGKGYFVKSASACTVTPR